MGKADHHTFQILTKRHERLAELAPSLPWPPEHLDRRLDRESPLHRIAPTICERFDAAVRFVSAEPLSVPSTASTCPASTG